MATTASKKIPNGTLYNYNPFTNIMPLNESWLYYKYTTTGVDLVHDLSLDSDKILLDANGDADIFILYAGGGSLGGPSGGYYTMSYDRPNGCGGGGGTGEVNLTKINKNTIKNNKINFNIALNSTLNTLLNFTDINNNLISYTANSNLNNGSAGANANTGIGDDSFTTIGGNGSNSAINTLDNRIGNLAYQNKVLYFGSGGGFGGWGGTLFTQIKALDGTGTTISNNNLVNVSGLTYVNINFSSNLLLSDNTSNTNSFSGSLGGKPILRYNSRNAYVDYIAGQNGPPGFVMIFYKVKNTLLLTENSTNITPTSYNPINNISPKNKHAYYLYNTTATHIINNDTNYILKPNGIKPDASGNKIVNILFVGGGGYGGDGKDGTGGGGGGGGGEVILSKIPYEYIENGTINISIGGTGNSTSISFFNNNHNNVMIIYTANPGNNGKKGSATKKAPGGNGGNGLSIRTTSIYNYSTFYGSGSGGGGGGYGKNSDNGSPGTIQTNVNSPPPTSKRSACPRCVQINDIGDETGEFQTSFGGWGSSGEKAGKDGNNGFVLIYYLVYG